MMKNGLRTMLMVAGMGVAAPLFGLTLNSSTDIVVEREVVLDETGDIATLMETGTVVPNPGDWAGKWNLVLMSSAEDDSGSGASNGTGASSLSFTVAKKSAAVTVSGTMVNGTKVSVKTTMYAAGEGVAAIPFVFKQGTSGGFSFIINIDIEGGLDLSSVSDWNATGVKHPFYATFSSYAGGRIGQSGDDEGGDRMFSFDSLDLEFFPGGYEWLSDVSPDGVGVICTAKKWKAEKAGKVKCSKKTGDYEASDVNPAALKLSYSKKKGTFSGSFVLYGILETNKGTYKFKKFKATVKGSVVGGVGYGTATIKNVGSFPVSVE